MSGILSNDIRSGDEFRDPASGKLAYTVERVIPDSRLVIASVRYVDGENGWRQWPRNRPTSLTRPDTRQPFSLAFLVPVTVNPQEWAEAYDTGLEDVREDAVRHLSETIREAVAEQLQRMAVGAHVEPIILEDGR